jgi:hypothetical protein
LPELVRVEVGETFGIREQQLPGVRHNPWNEHLSRLHKMHTWYCTE